MSTTILGRIALVGDLGDLATVFMLPVFEIVIEYVVGKLERDLPALRSLLLAAEMVMKL